MSMFSRILRVFRTQTPSIPAALSDLHSADQLRRILEREKSRADRSGVGFALLAFVPRDGRTSQATLVCLAEILKRRLRFTDEAGWLGDREIGAVLPCTSVAGARSVANDVRQAFTELEPPLCEVYCYPSDAPDESSGHRNGAVERQGSDAPAGALEFPCSSSP